MATIPLPALHGAPIQAPQSPLEMYAQALGVQNQQQQMQQRAAMAPLQQQQAQQAVQAGDLENTQRQQDLAARQALNKAYADAVTTDANGNQSFDSDKLQRGLANSPAAYQLPTVMKGITDFHKAKMDLQKTAQDVQVQSQDMLGSAAAAVKAAGYDPALAHSLLDQLPQSPQLAQIRQSIDGNPDQFKQMVDTAIQNSPKQRELAAAELTAGARKTTADTEAAKLANSMNPQSPLYAPTPAAVALGTAPGAQAIQANEVHQAAAKAGAEENARMPGEMALVKARDAMANGAAVNGGGALDWGQVAQKYGMSAQAFDQTAEKYFETGNLPAIGRSPNAIAMNRDLMNRAAELHPNASLAANSAEFKANADSLKKLQTNFDQVQAFESTAEKNIDLLQSTAQKIPDLGTRFANVPVRMLSKSILGTENQAAFNTALNTAQTEAAKVLNSSNASGVLSDSARHELQEIVDGNLPYKSMVASLNTLKQDMANRRQAYQGQIADIQGRLTGGSKNAPATQPQGGGGTQAGGAPKVGSIVMQNGYQYRVTAVDANGKPTGAEAVQ